MSVTLELDFTGKQAAGAGLGYLTTGLQKGMIVEFAHYADSNRLYCYMVTDGIRHRDSFSLSEKALPFLMGFLISAGVPEKKLNGKVTIPFDKLVGKDVYFNYTAPRMEADGRKAEGSYPDYRYITAQTYASMHKAMAAAAPKNFEVETVAAAPVAAAPVVNEAAVAASATPQESEDEFSFLMN